MIEALEYYTSGFWIWAGITFAISLFMNFIVALVRPCPKSLDEVIDEVLKDV